MKVAAFLFDLDGTLVDTEEVWAKAMADYILACGGHATAEGILKIVVGRSWLDIHAELHKLHPELGNTTPEQDSIALRPYFQAYATDPAEMRIENSIRFFRKVCHLAPCAIVSGSAHEDIVNALKLCGIENQIQLILGAGEYAAGKPSPSGYLKAAELLGVNPSDCVVFEDSTVGVAAGVAAGMKVVVLDRGKSPVPQRFEGYTWKVRDLLDLDEKALFS